LSKEKDEDKSKRLSRRDFLKGAGAGAAVGVLAAVSVEEYRVSSLPKPAPPPPPSLEQSVMLNINGNQYDLAVDNRLSLRDALRDKLGLTGTKDGCSGRGECGACTVLADGKPILSCLTLAVEAQDMKITTIEGLTDPKSGAMDPLQQAFWENDGLQCGYCSPGFIMLAKGFISEVPHPTEMQVKEALAGNLCRCGAHPNIVKSVLAASGGGS
jgi:aerobic-type carbon monoxide dehydrogenase small subunit (CoxS/CutS family)